MKWAFRKNWSVGCCREMRLSYFECVAEKPEREREREGGFC